MYNIMKSRLHWSLTILKKMIITSSNNNKFRQSHLNQPCEPLTSCSVFSITYPDDSNHTETLIIVLKGGKRSEWPAERIPV